MKIESYTIPCIYDSSAEWNVPASLEIVGLRLACDPRDRTIFIYNPEDIVSDEKQIEVTLFITLKEMNVFDKTLTFDEDVAKKTKFEIVVDKEKNIAIVTCYNPFAYDSVAKKEGTITSNTIELV